MKKTGLILLFFAMMCGNMKAQTFWSNNTEPFTQGNGSPGNPYIISTPKQLAYLALMVKNQPANYADKSYRLNVNINLSEHYWDLPIGATEPYPFRGKFDGNEKNISGMFMHDLDGVNYIYTYWGLFGVATDAEIVRTNLYITSYISVGTIGTLIGYANKTVVTDCLVWTNINLMTGAGGGFIGNAEESTISNCSFYGLAHCSSYYGGFIGNSQQSVISNCHYFGDVSSGYYNHHIGGFIGSATYTTVSNCSFSGSVGGYGYDNIGGFIGVANNSTFSDCIYSGTVIAYGNNVGGFIGYGTDINCTGCSSEGTVAGSESVGGFVGKISDYCKISDCYTKSSTSGLTEVGGFIGMLQAETIVITDCYVKGAVIGLMGFVGGFIGSLYKIVGDIGNIERCFTEVKVTGLGDYVGGFSGRISTSENLNLNLSNCYSISATSGFTDVGGFCGNNWGTSINNCHSNGSVEGIERVGGFMGSNVASEISHCSTGVSTEGRKNVGGFIGLEYANSVLSNCFSVSDVKGDNYIGSFCGLFQWSTVINCFSVGTIIGNGYNLGGFIGYNNTGNYENCYFDKQTSCVLSGTANGDIDGIQGLPTSQLTQNTLPPGLSADDWVPVSGYYPQLKVFVESKNDILKTHSALLAVPLKLANDTESVSDIQTFFQLADKTPDGKDALWGVDPFENVTIFRNTVYAEKSNNWRTLTLRYGELERIFKFRAPEGLLSADILDVKSNHPANGNMFNYLIGCNSKDEYAYADITLPPYATCTPGSPITLYANIPQKVTVTSIDGQSKTYTFVAEKRLPSDIFIQRWNDVLAINNNFATNGGYNFIAYEWYKNGNKMQSREGYIQEPGGLSRTAEYTAIVTTQQDNKLGVCPAVLSSVPAPKMAVYPNPARSGQTIRVETGIATGEQNNAVMQLFNATGNLVAKQTLNAPIAELTAPDTPGQYLLQITMNGMVQTFKIVVE